MVGAVPGLLMKSGAEGVCAFALSDGRAAAVKFDDGAHRPVAPLMARLLADLIATEPVGRVDPAILAGLTTATVTGGGEPVGEVRAVIPR